MAKRTNYGKQKRKKKERRGTKFCLTVERAGFRKLVAGFVRAAGIKYMAAFPFPWRCPRAKTPRLNLTNRTVADSRNDSQEPAE